MSCLTGIPLEQCVGAGSGLYGEAMTHKFRVLQQALRHFSGEHTVEEILCRFGGLEMMMAVGGMLRAGRAAHGHSGGWLYHDQLYTGCFAFVSRRTFVCCVRTSGR